MDYRQPYDYDEINLYNGSFSPSMTHADSQLKRYFMKYLLEKIFSVYEFKNIPKDWDMSYFLYSLFGIGFIGIINTSKYGTICQHGTLNGRGIFYQPTRLLISNPRFDKTYNLTIGKECALIKVQPNYSSVMDIVSYYADMLALSSATASSNLINSKLAYVFFGQNKNVLESFKKMYDKIASNEPSVFIDRNLFDEDGNPQWMMFNQNLKQTYIAGDVLMDMSKWMDMFNTEIGIPNANTEKKERMLTDEVNANNVDTKSKAELWLNTMKLGFEQANDLFGLDLDVEFRFEKKEDMTNDNVIESRNV